METTVKFTPECDYSNEVVERDSSHKVSIQVDSARNYALIESSSREALYELGRSLMEAALFGYGELEFYPLVSNGEELIVNGVRVSESSARLFVHFPRAGGHEL